MIFEARGQYGEAEAAYRAAELRKRAASRRSWSRTTAVGIGAPAGDRHAVLSQARMKAKQGRLAEAEVDARRALLSRLKDTGKYNPMTPRYVMGLANILIEEGRYDEAEKLRASALEINRTSASPTIRSRRVQLLSQLGAILTIQRKTREAGDDLCADRQGDRQLGAAAPRGASSSTARASLRSTIPGSSKPASPRRNGW